MNKTTRILSLLLALVVLFGCLSTVVAAAKEPETIQGGEITTEDVTAGTTDAITGALPEANGILSIEELSKLVTLIKSNNCDGAPSSGTNTLLNATNRTDKALGRTYITVGAPDATKVANLGSGSAQVYQDLRNSFTGIPNSITATSVETYKGASFVLSFDVRLDENFNQNTVAIALTTYAATKSGEPNTLSTIQLYLLSIRADGTLYIPDNGSERPEKSLPYKLPKSTVAADGTVTKADFTTVAVHVNPKTNTYDVYANGERCGSDIVFLSKAQQTRIAGVDAGKEYTYSSAQYTSDYDFSETDYLLGFARFFPSYQTDWLKDLTGDVYSYDNLKLYYADSYLECAEHSFVSGEHTHDDATITASTPYSCENCRGSWNISVPIDQTGNGLCDLCEIYNDCSHTFEHVHDYTKNLIYGTSCVHCGADNVAVLDGNGDKLCDICTYAQLGSANGQLEPDKLASVIGASNIVVASTVSETSPYGVLNVTNSAGCITQKTENGNTYLQYIGKQNSNGESYIQLNTPASGSSMIKNYEAYKGRSYVYSIDVRLGTEYSDSQNVAQTLCYMKPKATDKNGYATQFDALNITFLKINSSGQLVYRKANGNTSSNVTVPASTLLLKKGADEFTTIAMHVKPDGGDYGAYSIYINGKLLVEDVQLLTKTESDAIVWTTADGKNSRGAKDFTLGFVRAFALFPSSTLDSAVKDFLSLDNPKLYYSDKYVECAEHQYEYFDHTHDIESGNMNVTFACVCGEQTVIELPLDTMDNGCCDTCDSYLLAEGIKYIGRQVVLGADIGLKLAAKISQSVLENPTAKVIVSCGEKSVEFLLSETTPDASGNYIFDIYLTSIEMAADVSAVLEVDGHRGEAFTTSVRDYAMALMKITKKDYELELCRTMLNYGAYAQEYFASKHEDDTIASDLANAQLSDEDKAVAEYTASDFEKYKFSGTGMTDEVYFSGATFVLSSKTDVKIYFKASKNASVTINGRAYPKHEEGGEYFVTYTIPTPAHAKQALEVKINDGSTVASASISAYTVIYSALSNQATDDKLCALLCAYAQYCECAASYVSNKA